MLMGAPAQSPATSVPEQRTGRDLSGGTSGQRFVVSLSAGAPARSGECRPGLLVTHNSTGACSERC